MTEQGGFDSVFLRQPRRGRAEPTLTRGRIVEATITLLDTEGAAALTMRGLAGRLGVHATSLYWYVNRREDLIDLALDEIIRPVAESAPPPGEWDDVVTGTTTALFDALTVHSWAPAFFGTRPLIGPNAVAVTTRVLQALQTTGADPATVASIASAVSHLAIGAATTAAAATAAQLDTPDSPAARRMAAHIADATTEDTPVNWRPDFPGELAMLLTGVRARLDATRPRSPR